MLDEIVNFIWDNYPGVHRTIAKDKLADFVSQYRHRIVFARSKIDNKLIGLICYLKDKDEIHFILAIRKKEYKLKDMFKIIRKIVKVEGCNKFFIYSEKHKPKEYKLCLQ